MNIGQLSFLETNPIVRAFTNDDPEKSRKSQKLLEDLENKTITASTSSLHIGEVIYVLRGKYYNVGREDVANALLNLVRLSELKIDDKAIVERALVIYRDAGSDLDFPDAYAIAYCEEKGMKDIISYDTDFDEFDQIKRVEP